MEIKKIIIQNITDAFFVFSKKGVKDYTKNRKCYGLSFCESGKITYIQGGKKTVSVRNKVILLPKGGNYSVIRQETGNFPVINFETNYPLTDKVLSFDVENNDILLEMFFKLKESFFKGDEYTTFSIFYKMLSLIFENAKSEHSKIEDYINENIADPTLSNKELAHFLQISESYLNKVFSKEYNMSPKKYVISKRIDLAKRLLAENKLNITEICEKCGYNNLYSFSRAFKDFTKDSPLNYKKKIINRYL